MNLVIGQICSFSLPCNAPINKQSKFTLRNHICKVQVMKIEYQIRSQKKWDEEFDELNSDLKPLQSITYPNPDNVGIVTCRRIDNGQVVLAFLEDLKEVSQTS